MRGTIHLTVISAVLALGAALAHAQIAHEHGSDDERAMHEKFYVKWQRPIHRDPDGRRVQSCCSLQDCFPTQFRKQGGKWYALTRGGEWAEVPEEVLEHNQVDPEESPDGRGHACIAGHNVVICAVLGSET